MTEVVLPRMALPTPVMSKHLGVWSSERRSESSCEDSSTESTSTSSSLSSSPSSSPLSSPSSISSLPVPTMRRKQQRDPHRLPTFGSSEPTEPILYLPPLLSSLPAGYVQPPYPPTGYRPLRTESRLPEIDRLSLILHKVLHQFRPMTPEYSVAPYEDAFNWNELLLPEDAEGEWYAVVFRSKRKEGSDGGPLYDADRQAHEEAVRNGGLILYWYGIPHPVTSLNLATCIWQSRAHAMGAMSRPCHVRAMRLAAASYERYDLHRYRLIKTRGERMLRIVPYDKGDMGW